MVDALKWLRPCALPRSHRGHRTQGVRETDQARAAHQPPRAGSPRSSARSRLGSAASPRGRGAASRATYGPRPGARTSLGAEGYDAQLAERYRRDQSGPRTSWMSRHSAHRIAAFKAAGRGVEATGQRGDRQLPPRPGPLRWGARDPEARSRIGSRDEARPADAGLGARPATEAGRARSALKLIPWGAPGRRAAGPRARRAARRSGGSGVAPRGAAGEREVMSLHARVDGQQPQPGGGVARLAAEPAQRRCLRRRAGAAQSGRSRRRRRSVGSRRRRRRASPSPHVRSAWGTTQSLVARSATRAGARRGRRRRGARRHSRGCALAGGCA